MAERRTMFMCEECGKWFLSKEVFVRHQCCRNEGIKDKNKPEL